MNFFISISNQEFKYLEGNYSTLFRPHLYRNIKKYHVGSYIKTIPIMRSSY